MHDDGLLEQKAWAAGIASGYHDVDGRYYPAKPGVLAALLARLADEEHAEGDFDAVEVAAAGSARTLVLAGVDAPQAAWLADEAGVRQDVVWQMLSDGLSLALPALAEGYYEIAVQQQNGRVFRCFLIAAPDSAYEPTDLAAGHRFNGMTVQLYSLRSAANWAWAILAIWRR